MDCNISVSSLCTQRLLPLHNSGQLPNFLWKVQPASFTCFNKKTIILFKTVFTYRGKRSHNFSFLGIYTVKINEKAGYSESYFFSLHHTLFTPFRWGAFQGLQEKNWHMFCSVFYWIHDWKKTFFLRCCRHVFYLSLIIMYIWSVCSF